MDTTGAGAGSGPGNTFGIEGLTDVTPIGSGGSARVFRATQTTFDRTVAVKVLNASDDQLQRRFDRERRAMGRLSNHPGIVPVYSSDTTTLGQPYLIMPYYRNGSLADRIERDGAIPWGVSVSMMTSVSAAIAHAHDHDVLHLDLKPANVMLADDASPLVADFGIAKILSDNTVRGTTNTSFTPIFCPPEVLLGDRPGHQADVYGLGATLWALLAGQSPFLTEGDGNNSIAAVMHRVSTQPPSDLRHLAPGWVCDVVEHAMAKDPAARPASARLLAELLAGQGTVQATVTAPPQPAAAAPLPPADQAPSPMPAAAAPAPGLPPHQGGTPGLGTANTMQATPAAQLGGLPPGLRSDQVDSGSPLKTVAALVGLLLLGLLGYGVTRMLLSDGDTEVSAAEGDLTSEISAVDGEDPDAGSDAYVDGDATTATSDGDAPDVADVPTADASTADASTAETTAPPTTSPPTTTPPTTEAPTTEAPTTAPPTTDAPTTDAPTTEADGGAATGPLGGDHGLTLQWISWEPDEWGAVRFDAVGSDTYTVRGRQDGPDGEYVSIDGVVTQISDTELRFEGTVETLIGFGNDGQVCVREGVMTFLSTQNRQYWRLQDLLNCDGVHTDYVDIYF